MSISSGGILTEPSVVGRWPRGRMNVAFRLVTPPFIGDRVESDHGKLKRLINPVRGFL